MPSVVVIFDIVAGNLQVANLRAFDSYSTNPVITDVAAGDVNLMQVYMVQEDAYTRVVIYVAMADQHIAIALCQADPMTTAANQHTLKNGLDRKSTRLNSSHVVISYAVFCWKKQNTKQKT